MGFGSRTLDKSARQARGLYLAIALLCLLFGSACHSAVEPPPTGLLPATATSVPASGTARGDVNLSHLNFLVEDADIAGQPMAITHIYSEYPHYAWVDASSLGATWYVRS